MALTHFGAGTETIGITLSAVLYNIITQPGLQKRLHEELDDALKEGRLTCSAEGVVKIGNASKELKLLEACLRESMRLHPVIGVSFPRVVRPEGMVIDGVVIPGGVSLLIPLHLYHIADGCL
jgi:cytochrome P450